MEFDIDTDELIELIKMNPVLYERQYSSATSIKERERAWQNIARKNGVDVGFIRGKWKSLRDSFLRYMKKARQSEGDSVVIGWPYFEKLLFLKDHVGVSKFKKPKSEDMSCDIFENDPNSNDADSTMSKAEVQKFENEDWSQFEDEGLDDGQSSLERISMDEFLEFDKREEQSPVAVHSSSKRKQRNSQKEEDSDEPPRKQIILKEESDMLDKNIAHCIEIFKERLEKKKDAIDNFCEFISSFIKQWPATEQCEAIKYMTEYVMEKHLNVINDSAS